MNKVFFAIMFLMAVTARLMAQPNSIVEKYANDTAGFKAYPDVFLLDNMKPAKSYKRLEINTINFMYRARGDNRPQDEYRNVYSYPAIAKKSSGTIVLTKCGVLKCFSACWCPDGYPWYISAQTKDNKLITVGDTNAVKTFLSKINDKFNAYFWLQLHHMQYQGIPVKASRFFKYKKVKNGFLISFRDLIETSPVTNADLTYFISNDFKIRLISTKNVVVTKGLSYRI